MANKVSSFADTLKKMGVTTTPSVSSPASQSGGSAGSGQGSAGSSSPFEEAMKKIGIYTPRDAAEANELLQRSVDQSGGIADYLNSEEPMTWEERSRYQDAITGSRNQISKIQEIYGTEGISGLSDWYDEANRNLAAKTSNWKAEQQAQGGGLEELAQETAAEEKPSLWQRIKNLFKKPEVSTADWKGRDALIQELNDIDANSGWVTDPQQANQIAARRSEILRQLEQGDLEAGNGVRSYNDADRVRQIFSGSTKDYGAGVENFAGTGIEAAAALAERLGGNLDPYAGYATDEMTAGTIQQNSDWSSVREEGQRLEAAADRLGESARMDLESAKSGLSKLGQAGVDIAQNLIQMGYDAGLGTITGVGSLAPMFIRSAGTGAQTARQEGATLGQQVAYGAVSGGIEVLTEKLFDGVARIYGAGVADEAVEEVIRKLSKSDFGRSALRWLASAAGEGLEEGIADLLAPVAEIIYKDESLGELYRQIKPSEVLYDVLIGAAVGGLGGATNIVNGESARQNATLQLTDTAEQGLLENGYDKGNATEFARLIAKQMSGEELTAAEQKRFDGRPTAQQVMENMTKSKTNEDAVSKAIGETAEQYLRRNYDGLDEAEVDALIGSYNAGSTGSQPFLFGTREAYSYGKNGLSLEEARNRAAFGKDISEKQFSDAWKLGALKQGGSVDISSEKGKTEVEASLDFFGKNAGKAAEVYESTQDVGRYAKAMQRAAELYAAHGADLTEIAQEAKSGGRYDSVAYLTDAQIQVAQEIGQQIAAERQQAAQSRSEEFKRLKAKAQNILAEPVTVREMSRALNEARDYLKTAQADLDAAVAEMTAMQESGAWSEDEAAYQAVVDRVEQLTDAVDGTKQAIEDIEQARDAERAKAPKGKKKQGSVTFEAEAGNVGGAAYQAVDRSKLSRTQRAVANIAEAIARASGLEIHIADFGEGIGGEYLREQGGVLWLNINASVDGQNIAIGALSHELTHWLQEYAPAEYAELKEVVLSEMLKNPAEYESIFGRRSRTEGKLTPDQITDEMVANACQTILMDPEAVQRIVNEHKSLAERIWDFLKNLIEDIRTAFEEMQNVQGFELHREVRAAEGALDQMREIWTRAFAEASENMQAAYTVQQAETENNAPAVAESERAQEERTAGLDTREQTKVQYQRYVQDEETAKFLKEQEDEGKVIHTYKSFLEIDGKLYPPMASKEKGADGKYRMRNGIEPGRWVESEGNLKNIIIDPETGKGYFNLKKDDGSTVKAAYNPYQHSSNLMLNDQFTGAYSRPNLVTYECIIPESELNSGYRAEYAKDAVGLHPWKSGPVAGKLVKAKGTERQVYLSRWLKPVRKVPEAEVAQHYKDLLDGTDIGVPSNVVPPALLRALEDAGVKIEYDDRAPKQERGNTQFMQWDGEPDYVGYNDRALISEDTLDRWLKDYASSNPDYAQAYIAYMSPLDFLRMTTSGIASRQVIAKQAEGLTVEKTLDYSKAQPIQLRIDTQTGKVEGHEGRHRMVALRQHGIRNVPVLLFDSSNKYSKSAMDSLRLIGQDFNGAENTADVTIRDVQPLSRGNRDAVKEKFGTKSATERLREKYSGTQTAQFMRWGGDDSEAIRSSMEEHHWGENFPPVMYNTNLTGMYRGDRTLHEQAKNGDAEAARQLVTRSVKPEKLRAFANEHRGAVLVPVRSSDTEGKNKIPYAYAAELAKYGLDIDDSIIQIGKAGHTNSNAVIRIIEHAAFDGDVIEGQDYILVDDVLTFGGTLNDLRKFIESKGGRVVACTTLAIGRNGKHLAIRPELVQTIYDKHGTGIDTVLREEGVAYDVASLTDRQGRFIRDIPAGQVRNRIAQDGAQEGYRGSEEAGENEEEVSGRAQFMRWDGEDDYRESLSDYSENQLVSLGIELQYKINQDQKQLDAMKGELDARVKKFDVNDQKSIDAYKKWEDESGYGALYREREELRNKYRVVNELAEEKRVLRTNDEERQAIEASGLSEEEYFRKLAIKEFGYTSNLREAGYLLPNGKMLNFSGEKGRHAGYRAEDHRAISRVFANSEGTAALVRFVNQGNIRMMPEAPGFDVSAAHEPTAEQYRMIRTFVRESMDEDYFIVDIDGPDGYPVANLEYEGTIRPDRVINDIKYYYQTGEVRSQGLSAFYMRWDLGHNEWAPEFYSQMQKTVDEWSNEKGRPMPAKMAGNAVIPWLRGRGVKAEEIRWSGIQPWLEGKKSVTKEELQAFMAENQVQIDTKVLRSGETRPDSYEAVFEDGSEESFSDFEEMQYYADELARHKAGANARSSWWRDGDEYIFEAPHWSGEGTTPLFTAVLLEGSMDPGETHWSDYNLYKGSNYREIMFKLPGLDYEADMGSTHWKQDAPGVIAHARVQDAEDQRGYRVLFIEEIQSDLHNDGTRLGYKDSPDALHTLQSMEERRNAANEELRKNEERFRALAKTIDDGLSEQNPDFKHTPESVYNWMIGKEVSPIADVNGAMWWLISDDDSWNAVNTAMDLMFDEEKEVFREAQRIGRAASDAERIYRSESRKNENRAPDVPFAGSADTYHEYVMKHLLRLAAEGGYDAIGWTTAEMQADRWQEPDQKKYEKNKEAYRIEYNQNIPKFMRKYVKQWGGKVGETELSIPNEDGGSVDVWNVDITDEMKEAVLYKGQAQFMAWDVTDDDTAAEAEERELAYSRMQAENAILDEAARDIFTFTKAQKRSLAEIQARLRIGKSPEARRDDARKTAKRLIRDNSSTLSVDDVTNDILHIWNYVLQEKDPSVTVLNNMTRDLAEKIVNNAQETIENPENEVFKEIKGRISGKKFVIASTEAGDIPGYENLNEFRKKNFGRFTVAARDSKSVTAEHIPVDSFYEELRESYGNHYFPELTNQGEMLGILSNYFSAAEPETVNPHEKYMGESIQAVAAEISRMSWWDELRLAPMTKEEKLASRNAELNERIKALTKEKKLTEKEAAKLSKEVGALAAKLDRQQAKYEALRERSEARLAQVREEGRARAAQVKAQEKERTNRKVAALKEHYADMQKRAKERREESASITKYRARVTEKAGKLYEMLMKNDNKTHVPEVLKGPLAEFLSEIDFSSKRLLNGGEETRNDQTFGARLQRLQQLLSGQQSYLDGSGEVQEDLGGYIDVSQDSLDFLRRTAELITRAMANGETYTINRMSGAELKDLSNFLSNLTAAIRNMNSFMANARYESVREAASGDVDYMQSLGKAGKLSGTAVSRFAAWENGTPYYVMRRFGAGGRSIFDGFARGWEKLAINAQEIIKFTEGLYTDREVNDWKSHIHEIMLSDGKKIQMTTAQIMELSMLLNRDQARQHIERGGIRIGDIEQKVGKIHDTTHYHLTFSDIQKITGELTERQRTVAKSLQQYMAVRGADWGNEISMRRFGYKFYTEGENYYPIKTDSNDRPMSDTDMPENASMFRLLNLSSSKALNPKASNALVVGNIFDTYADHMSDMAKLNGMGLPVLDAIKWFNYKERIDLENGEYDTRTLQGAMEQAYGKDAQHYFRTLMKDINGVTESGDRGTSLATKLMSNYKIAAVGANLRVALLQPTSYLRAMTVLKPQHLVGTVPSRAAYQEAMKYSGTAVWKALGYYDTDVSRGMRGQIQHDDTIKDKIAEASMKAAELGDQMTWSRLWTACKRQARAENRSLSGDALCEAAADLFREVVYSSQVMDSTLTRSETMRSKTLWSKSISAFMAEPTLSYNILLDAANAYSRDVREHGKAGAWQRNGKTLGRAFAVYLCSAVYSAVVESIADAARDDDDEAFLDKWLEAFLGKDGKFITGNLSQDLTVLGKLPFVKDFISTLQGYSSSNMSVAAFNNIVNVYKIWEETIKLNNGELEKATNVTYYGKMTEWGKIYKTLQALSQLSGLAVANLTRDATAIWNTVVNGRRDEWKIRTYDGGALSQSKLNVWKDQLKPLGITKNQYQELLKAADSDGNGSLKREEIGAWLTEQVQAGTYNQEQAAAIWAAVGPTWKKSFEEWGEKSSGTSKAAENTQEQTTVKQIEQTFQVAAQTPVQGTAVGTVGSYDDFKKMAPLYGKEKKEASYAVWENQLKGSGMSLERYVEILSTADTDHNSSLKQAELGYALREAIARREMSYDQAAAVWAAQGWTRTFDYWNSKN
ncbi:MAG: hypothetical protein IJV40_03525 [Oscillospiraceae bacterium]|nr:hypothetical protein [Oscillospiraceae bacterium]